MPAATYTTVPALLGSEPRRESATSSTSSIATLRAADTSSTPTFPRNNATPFAKYSPSSKPTTAYPEWPSGSPSKITHRKSPSKYSQDSGRDGVQGISRWLGSTDSNDTNSGAKRPDSFAARLARSTSARIGGRARRSSSPPKMQFPLQAHEGTQDSGTSFGTAPHSNNADDDARKNLEAASVNSQSAQHISQEPSHLAETSNAPLVGLDSVVTEAMAPDTAQVLSPSRIKSVKGEDKKTMLSKALQRANQAVEMDNAQDYAGAKKAYDEACDYLNRVISRSSNEDDKRKLEAIRATYTGRVQELDQLGRQWKPSDHESGITTNDTEPLPASPLQYTTESSCDNPDIPPIIRAATSVPIGSTDQRAQPMEADPQIVGGREETPRPPPTNQFSNDFEAAIGEVSLVRQGFAFSAQSKFSADDYVPSALAPGRRTAGNPASTSHITSSASSHQPVPKQGYLQPTMATSNVSHSMKGGEAGLARTSSKHSVSSSGIRRKNLRLRGEGTEAGFDLALDAAVEAAYDEGFEPYDDYDFGLDGAQPSIASRNPTAIYNYNSLMDRETAIRTAKGMHRSSDHSADTDEEERLLAEITKDFMIDNHNFDEQAKSAIPRQSDSSGSSGQTWGSSEASSLNTIGTPLSPVNENSIVPSFYKLQTRNLPPPTPPPTTALPELPPSATSPQHANAQNFTFPPNPSVQDRRTHGQRVRRLQIKTATSSRQAPSFSPHEFTAQGQSEQTQAGTSFAPSDSQRSESTYPLDSLNARSPITSRLRGTFDAPPVLSQVQQNFRARTSLNFSPPASTLDHTVSYDSDAPLNLSNSSVELLARPPSSRPPPGKNFSSLSLRTRMRPPSRTEAIDSHLETPVRAGYATVPGRKSPMYATSSGSPAAQHVKKVHLFSQDFHSPQSSQGSQKSNVLLPPRPLEPCPESSVLRPFWLMRCIYQTIAHPRGGYITTKLFIPRDVWIVKNVKLKAIEEKVAVCDMLFAALTKVGSVNTLDADAVLEQMQALEVVMDQTQISLTRKLGNDVGPQHVSSFFKDAPPSLSSTPTPSKADVSAQSSFADSSTNTSSTGSFNKTSSKSSYLSSWRKLRNKGSNTSLGTSFASASGAPKETMTMSTLPMTNSSTDEPPQPIVRRDYNKTQALRTELRADGPYAHYMSALARLCEAVQILDQIARQAEDPGLKKTSSTHVGLELSTRHAAEFFGFYICRFVLQDITMLADKFVKRATEWVLV